MAPAAATLHVVTPCNSSSSLLQAPCIAVMSISIRFARAVAPASRDTRVLWFPATRPPGPRAPPARPWVPLEAKGPGGQSQGVPREFSVRFSESGEGARGPEGGAKGSCETTTPCGRSPLRAQRFPHSTTTHGPVKSALYVCIFRFDPEFVPHHLLPCFQITELVQRL